MGPATSPLVPTSHDLPVVETVGVVRVLCQVLSVSPRPSGETSGGPAGTVDLPLLPTHSVTVGCPGWIGPRSLGSQGTGW